MGQEILSVILSFFLKVWKLPLAPFYFVVILLLYRASQEDILEEKQILSRTFCGKIFLKRNPSNG